MFFTFTSKYINAQVKGVHLQRSGYLWQMIPGIPGKRLLLDSIWIMEASPPPPITFRLRLLILFPLVLNSRAITFHEELKKTLLQELHNSIGWSCSRGNGNVNKQSRAISWSRARKGRELVGAGQVSGYIPWGRTLAAMHRRAGSYLEELQKGESNSAWIQANDLTTFKTITLPVQKTLTSEQRDVLQGVLDASEVHKTP